MLACMRLSMKLTRHHRTSFGATYCSIRLSSNRSWNEYTRISLPWASSSSQNDGKSGEIRLANARKAKIKRLERAIRRVVARELRTEHPDIFATTSMEPLLPKPPKNETNSDDKTNNSSSLFQKLAYLNGYKKVATPALKETVPLAEGVVAMPGYYSRRNKREYTLYSQPMDDLHKVPTIDDLPKLVEPDITIYRILESRVEDWLQSWYTYIDASIQQFLEEIGDPPDDAETKVSLAPTTVGTDMDENLLIVSDHNLVLVTHMRSSYRLLALPHDLGHKTASTLISVSLVLLSAMPVAYRSFNFALAYPGLALAIQASVVATIMYGIWSTRSSARTQQGLVVARALARRVFARDDAVVLVLQDGAIQRVTEAVLDTYLQPSNQNDALAKVHTNEKHDLPESLVDPVQIALELGLVEMGKDSKFKWTKPDLETAIDLVERKS